MQNRLGACPCVKTLSSPNSDVIRAACICEDHCVALLRALESKEFTYSDMKLLARLRARIHRYSIHQGLLCFRTRIENITRIVIPHDEELRV